VRSLNPSARPRKLALPCACQRRGGRSHAQKKQTTTLLQDRFKASRSGSRKGRGTQQPHYKFAMEHFITWYCSEPRLALIRSGVLRFRLHLRSLGLAAGTVNQRLAAVRRLAYEAADSGLLCPELAAGIRRVKGAKQLGAHIGNWLAQGQARLLLERADRDDLRSVRRTCDDLRTYRLRIAPGGAVRAYCRGSTNQARSLGNRGSGCQGRTRSNRSSARLGQGRSRSMERIGEGDRGSNLPSRKPAWNALGQGDFGECHLVGRPKMC
jgi:hypothetical protein